MSENNNSVLPIGGPNSNSSSLIPKECPQNHVFVLHHNVIDGVSKD